MLNSKAQIIDYIEEYLTKEGPKEIQQIHDHLWGYEDGGERHIKRTFMMGIPQIRGHVVHHKTRFGVIHEGSRCKYYAKVASK